MVRKLFSHRFNRPGCLSTVTENNRIDAQYRQALIYEGEQAWEHYRHVENQRNLFLGFLLTVTFAAVGLIVTLSSRTGHNTPDLALTAICPIVCAVTTLAVAIYWAISRFCYILEFYRQTLLYVRNTLFDGIDSIITKDIVEYLPLVASGRFIGPQAVSEVATVSIAITCVFTQLFVACSMIWIISYSPVERIVITVCTVYVSLIITFSARRALQAKRARRSFVRDRRHL